MSLSEQLASWVGGLRYEDLPPAAVRAAKRQILGILGAAYAGTRMDTAAGLHDGVAAMGDRPEATVIGGAKRFMTSMRSAGMANSFLAQILEWEDFLLLSHAGASVVPAALAVAEALGRSGRELLAAIVAGNEVVGRSGEIMQDGTNLGNAVPNHQIEVPLVAGKLLGLDAERLADAVGISCTQPQLATLVAWPAPAKGMLTGWPVATGITAAQLAAAGVVGSHEILDGPLGFVGRISDVEGAERLQLLVKDLGTDWRTETLIVKPYPADGFIMTAIRAAIDLVNDGLRHEDVQQVVLYANVPFAATSTLFSEGKAAVYDKIRTRRDWSYIALQYDGYYPIAAALVFGRLGWQEWTDAALFDPRVQALLTKIRLVPDVVVGVWGAEIVVQTTDGRTLTRRVDCIEEVDAAAKLREGAAGLVDPEPVIAAVEGIENMADVRELTSHL